MSPARLPAAELEGFVRRHRGSLVASAVVLLCGFGITAVAVAPLAPDAAELPRRVISESITPPDLAQQLQALSVQSHTLTRSDLTRGTDTPEALLQRLGVRDGQAAAFLRADPEARKLLSGRGGRLVQVELSVEGFLESLVARWPSEATDGTRTHFTRLSMNRAADGRWAARTASAAYGTEQRLASGTITSTLFSATDEAGIPDAVAAQIADIFSTDIDFHRELRKGDTFSVVYESLTADGQPVPWNEGAGRVIAAEFVNGGRSHHAVWFTRADGRAGYYGADGRSLRRSFLASPMEFSRITSGFAMRFHPLQQRWRKHLGVDYAAPTGTPVRTVADGVVSFSGWQNGYGKTIEIDHGNGKGTLYAHLSRQDVRKGSRVQQGQRIGAVGSTGWSTGPHLHFEFRVNGTHQDPLRVAKASEAVVLDGASKPRFEEVVRSVRAKLELAESLSAPVVAAR
ncbi:MAG: M23 family metallopeptidase [Rubrivivax sp.]|nr:M23 family metallopeptidase [Rubrivivax sp.]